MKILLAAGGTGGHIYPALAVARAVHERGGEALVLGQEGGMEARVVPEHGVEFVGVRAGKWDRQRPDPRQAIAALAGLLAGVRAVARHRPDAVIGFGGFASFPGCAAATLLGIPLFLHEGNAFPGRVVRWFQGRARAVLAAQEEVARRLPRARRVIPVGFPVREDRVPRAEARRSLGLPEDGVVTLVMGGSQGSVALNRVVPEAWTELPADVRPVVLHSAGPAHVESLRSAAPWPGYHCTGFVDATLAWSAADLAITRAGISTLAEAAFHGVPVIAVPLPTSSEDHQRHNARALARAGAGRHVEQTDRAGLVAAWRELLAPDVRAEAAAKSELRTPVGAADTVVREVTEAIGKSRRAERAPEGEGER